MSAPGEGEVEGIMEVFDMPTVGMGVMLYDGRRAYVTEVDADAMVATIRTQLWQVIRMRIRVVDAP